MEMNDDFIICKKIGTIDYNYKKIRFIAHSEETGIIQYPGQDIGQVDKIKELFKAAYKAKTKTKNRIIFLKDWGLWKMYEVKQF